MGWSCSWVAIRGKDPGSVLARLGLRPSANREEIPEAPWTGAVLPNGWYLVFCSARCDPPELGEAALGSRHVAPNLVPEAPALQAWLEAWIAGQDLSGMPLSGISQDGV